MNATDCFPYPIPEYGAKPYWDACNDGRLVMQRCSACARFRWHPAPLCPDCGGREHTWDPLSGRGTVTTWTVVTHPVHPAASSRVPYVVCEVELEEQAGLRMLSNVVDCDPDTVSIGMAVEVAFEAHPTGQMLPVFRPVK